MAAPALVQAGVPGDEVVKLVSDFLTQMNDAVKNASECRPTPLDTNVEAE